MTVGVPPAPRSRIDDTDRSIIRQLQADGRLPFSRLGPAVGLSPAAVRQRVLQLIEDGVIAIVAITDPAAAGQLVQVMLGIRVQGDLGSVVGRLEAQREIVYLVVTAGRFDLLAEVVCENTDRLLEILQTIRMLEGVQSAEVFTYLRLVKQTYNWGVG